MSQVIELNNLKYEKNTCDINRTCFFTSGISLVITGSLDNTEILLTFIGSRLLVLNLWINRVHHAIVRAAELLVRSKTKIIMNIISSA